MTPREVQVKLKEMQIVVDNLANDVDQLHPYLAGSELEYQITQIRKQLQSNIDILQILISSGRGD